MTPLLLSPLTWAYASVVRARNRRFDHTAPHRLRWPVVSVGNLSVGGAGKTPLVIYLARLLSREGFLPDVLSRGYGRTGSGVEAVNAAGSAAQFGDEPLLLARAAGVPVYVGASRYEAGLLAESLAGSEGRHVHLLDDGLQHRQLGRDVDIVVVHRSDLQQRLLPAGRLREPLAALGRAQVIVLRSEDADLAPALRRYAHRDCGFWQMRRSLTIPAPVRRAMAFCAIARPEEFFRGLASAGVEVGESLRFRDHHRFTPADIDRLAAMARRGHCDSFVMTAKDAVKLDAGLRQRLQHVAPVVVADLTVEMEDESAVMDYLGQALRI